MGEVESVALDHEGTELVGEVYRPADGGPAPAVLVAHSALGIRHVERQAAERLADAGFVAVALDVFGTDYDGDLERAPEFFMALVSDPETLRARMVAWFERVAALDGVDAARVAAIGYCFGGQCVLELARSGADLVAAVSFHGLLTTHAPAEPGAIGGHVVAWCGADDPYAPPEHVDAFRAEMAAAGAATQVTVFGGVAHAFTDPRAAELARPGIEYDELADRVSWAGTSALLATLTER